MSNSVTLSDISYLSFAFDSLWPFHPLEFICRYSKFHPPSVKASMNEMQSSSTFWEPIAAKQAEMYPKSISFGETVEWKTRLTVSDPAGWNAKNRSTSRRPTMFFRVAGSAANSSASLENDVLRKFQMQPCAGPSLSSLCALEPGFGSGIYSNLI